MNIYTYNSPIKRIESKNNFDDGRDFVDHLPPLQITRSAHSGDSNHIPQVRPYSSHFASENKQSPNNELYKHNSSEYTRTHLRNNLIAFDFNNQRRERDLKSKSDTFSYFGSDNLNNNIDLRDNVDQSLETSNYEKQDDIASPEDPSASSGKSKKTTKNHRKERQHNKSFTNFIRSAKKSFKRNKTTSSTNENKFYSQNRQDFYQKEIADDF